MILQSKYHGETKNANSMIEIFGSWTLSALPAPKSLKYFIKLVLLALERNLTFKPSRLRDTRLDSTQNSSNPTALVFSLSRIRYVEILPSLFFKRPTLKSNFFFKCKIFRVIHLLLKFTIHSVMISCLNDFCLFSG